MLSFCVLLVGVQVKIWKLFYHPIRKTATNARSWREHQSSISSIDIQTVIQTNSITAAGGGRAEVDENVVYRTTMLSRLICS